MEDVSTNFVTTFQIESQSNEDGHIAEDQEDMELFSDDFSSAFVRSLLKLQAQVVTLPNSREHYDIYLAQKMYPVLVPALEELSREITRIIENQGSFSKSLLCLDSIDPSIRERFNPCIYLGEFLMRNNPKFGTALEYDELF